MCCSGYFLALHGGVPLCDEDKDGPVERTLLDWSKIAAVLELDLKLTQTHMTQKPMLRVEVGALGAHQVKNMRGEGWTGAKVQGACLGGCGYLAPTGPLTVVFLFKWIHFMSFSRW